MSLNFQDLPDKPSKYQRLDLERIGYQLIDNPGRWAVIHKGPYERLRGLVKSWQRRRVPSRMPRAAYEFEVRRVPGKRKARLYARTVKDAPTRRDPFLT